MPSDFRCCLTEYEKLLGKFHVQDAGEARVAVCLILTAAEQFGAALTLYENGYSSHAQSHIRSMLEAHISVEILARDPTHADQLVFESAREEKKFLDEYISTPEIQDDEKALDLVRGMLDDAQRALAKLAPLNLRHRTALQTFQLADKAELYLAFRQLSSFAHPDLRAVAQRHIGEKELLYKQPLPDSAAIAYLAMGLTMLVRLMERLPSFTDLTAEDLLPAKSAADRLLAARANDSGDH